jgi:hypothetical protein
LPAVYSRLSILGAQLWLSVILCSTIWLKLSVVETWTRYRLAIRAGSQDRSTPPFALVVRRFAGVAMCRVNGFDAE